LKLKKLPIIIESPFDDVDDIQKELDYIIERLK
jgi:hypothetical protein